MLAFHPWELKLLLHIQEIRSLGLDQFFIFLNYFDTVYFYAFLLFPMIWVGYSWRAGMKIIAILLISFLINGILKEVIMEPRPFHVDSTLTVIKVHGFGFPSGAAQTTVLLSAIFIERFFTRWWSWTIGMIYVLLISFSRLYLGVHFPSDIFGGWLIGFLLFVVYWKIFPWWCHKAQKYPYIALGFLGIIFPIIVYFSLPTDRVAGPIAGICSVSLGLAISIRKGWLLPKAKNIIRGFLRFIIAVAGMTFFYLIYHYLLLHYLPKEIWIAEVIFYTLLGQWLTFGSYLSCLWITKIPDGQ